MIENTYAVVLSRRRHTHRLKYNPGEFQGTSQPGRETSWGRSSARYLHVGGRGCSVVRHLSMVVQLGPQSHTWCSCPRRNPSRAERSPRAGIRVADRTQRETRSRSGVLGHYRNRSDRSLHQLRTARHHHPQTREKALVCQSSSYTELKTPAKLQQTPQRMQN